MPVGIDQRHQRIGSVQKLRSEFGDAAEPCFDRIAKLAAQLLHAPYALMALVDANRQWFKARYGLELDQAINA